MRVLRFIVPEGVVDRSRAWNHVNLRVRVRLLIRIQYNQLNFPRADVCLGRVHRKVLCQQGSVTDCQEFKEDLHFLVGFQIDIA